MIKSEQMYKIGELIGRNKYRGREDFWIIHDGNGKPHIYKIPKTLISQLRIYFPIKLILILDENRSDVFNTLKGYIEERVPKSFPGNLWNPISVDGRDNILKMCFANRKECQILLLITPESLERKVAEKLETKCRYSEEYDDPHIFINEVAKEGRIPGVENACDIFKLACYEEWFKSEKWFNQLSQVFDYSHPFLKNL